MRRRARRRPRPGFTLVELLVVTVIIGIIVSLILTAAFSGLQAANLQATRELIAKLDAAVADRIDALMSATPTVTGPNGSAGTHQALASVPSVATGGAQRAYVIARIDMIRAEMPDVWFPTSLSPAATSNPLNFGAVADANGSFFLPIGETVASPAVAPTGINGASFSAAAGIIKNLGNQTNGTNVVEPTGYDGIDNNADGNIDEFAEWTLVGGNSAPIVGNLAQHTHKTARSEALYAMLTEGVGPFGSAFSKDDFTAREVQDTDGDGLPEFVDAWGEPLQFFRWPTSYRSDTQRGALNPEGFDGVDNDGDGAIDNKEEAAVYYGASDTREQDTFDPNQQLVAPLWWGSATTPNANAASFQSMFFSLVEDLHLTSGGASLIGGSSGRLWDRSTTSSRRAFKMRPLIVSSGPDKILGIVQLTAAPSSLTAAQVLAENQAVPLIPQLGSVTPPNPDVNLNGNDDISNQTFTSAGGAR